MAVRAQARPAEGPREIRTGRRAGASESGAFLLPIDQSQRWSIYPSMDHPEPFQFGKHLQMSECREDTLNASHKIPHAWLVGKS